MTLTSSTYMQTNKSFEKLNPVHILPYLFRKFSSIEEMEDQVVTNQTFEFKLLFKQNIDSFKQHPKPYFIGLLSVFLVTFIVIAVNNCEPHLTLVAFLKTIENLTTATDLLIVGRESNDITSLLNYTTIRNSLAQVSLSKQKISCCASNIFDL